MNVLEVMKNNNMTDNRQLPQYGTMLVVSGPSGVGKSTICTAVREQFSALHFSISCTTRAPRPDEVHGEHYYFITRTEFEQKIADNKFIEYADVFGNYYGTLRSEVFARIQQGDDVFLDIDIQGAMQIKKYAINDELLRRCSESVFIIPPDHDELEKRLRGRETEDEATVQRRLAKSEHELSFWREYDYIIVNDTVEDAVKRMEAIIIASHCHTGRYKEILI